MMWPLVSCLVLSAVLIAAVRRATDGRCSWGFPW